MNATKNVKLNEKERKKEKRTKVKMNAIKNVKLNEKERKKEKKKERKSK